MIHRTAKPGTCRQHGFTLMEVVIAITILSITLILAFNALHFATKAWDKSVSNVEAVNHIAIIQDFLRRTIAEAQPVALDSLDRDPPVFFDGDQHTLQFIAPLSAQSAHGGTYVLYITTEPREQQTDLTLHYRRYYPGGGDIELGSESKYEILMENIQEAEFSYYGVVDPELSARWYASWKQQSRLPISVKLTVQSDSAAFEWPPLVATLTRSKDFLLRTVMDQTSLVTGNNSRGNSG